VSDHRTKPDRQPAGAKQQCTNCGRTGVLGVDFKKYSIRPKPGWRWRRWCVDCMGTNGH
jgi:hypothetical protein